MEGGDGAKWKRRKIGSSTSMNRLRMTGGLWGGATQDLTCPPPKLPNAHHSTHCVGANHMAESLQSLRQVLRSPNGRLAAKDP